MITPALAEIHRVCHTSYWRGLEDADSVHTGHHRHWTMLSYEEALQLVQTGTFSLPDDVVPESVRAWRKMSEAVDLIVTPQPTLDAILAESDRLTHA